MCATLYQITKTQYKCSRCRGVFSSNVKITKAGWSLFNFCPRCGTHLVYGVCRNPKGKEEPFKFTPGRTLFRLECYTWNEDLAAWVQMPGFSGFMHGYMGDRAEGLKLLRLNNKYGLEKYGRRLRLQISPRTRNFNKLKAKRLPA